MSIQKRDAVEESAPKVKPLKRALSIREALFSVSEEVEVKDAEGRILANYAVSCPPAIPVAICGEVIDKSAVKAFEYYKIEKIRVIK